MPQEQPVPGEQQDPYAPPPRHRERSGAVVRFAIVAALLGAAAWGYMAYQSQPQTALISPAAEEQSLANNAYDQPRPPAPTMAEDAPQGATPAQTQSAPEQPPA